VLSPLPIARDLAKAERWFATRSIHDQRPAWIASEIVKFLQTH